MSSQASSLPSRRAGADSAGCRPGPGSAPSYPNANRAVLHAYGNYRWAKDRLTPRECADKHSSLAGRNCPSCWRYYTDQRDLFEDYARIRSREMGVPLPYSTGILR